MSQRLVTGRWFPLGLMGCLVACLLCGGATARAGEVIGTKNGKVYHTRPVECASARKIQDDNKVTFASEQEAKNAGRRLCKRCETLDRETAAKGDAKKPTGPGPSRNGPGDGSREAKSGEPPEPKEDRAALVETESDTIIPEFAGVTRVLSGGTLQLDCGENAVLVGIRCPSRGQPSAKAAVRFLTEQTRGRTVRMVYESGDCRTAHRDELGRLQVYITPVPDGRDIGGELLFQGYAWVDRSLPFARRAEYLRLEEESWRAARGVWLRGGDHADAQSVVTSRHSHCYHAPGCAHVPLLTGLMTLTMDEARGRRLVPCDEFHGGGK